MIRLLIVDAGHTLGITEGPGADDLVRLSPLGYRDVKEVMRRFLHCTPEPSASVLESLCEALLIDPCQLPHDWTSNFTTFRYSSDAMSAMIDETGAVAVVLSNMPCTTGPSRMRALHSQLPMIDAIYTSYDMGMRKPDSRLWRHIIDRYNVHPSEVVHVGDQWVADVRGAIRAGCNAIFLEQTREHNTAPAHEEWPAGDDRIQVVPDLSAAAPVVAQMHHK